MSLEHRPPRLRNVAFELKAELVFAPLQGYAPLCEDYEDFYTRRLYKRIHDCWNRPISSAPGAWIDVEERAFSNDSDRDMV